MITVRAFADVNKKSSSHIYKLIRENPKTAPVPLSQIHKAYFYDEGQLIKFIEECKSINKNKIKKFGKKYNGFIEVALTIPDNMTPLTALNSSLRMNVEFKKALFIKDKY